MSDIFDLIDNVIAQHGDAMRWSPDAPDPTPSAPSAPSAGSLYSDMVAMYDRLVSAPSIARDEPDPGLAFTEDRAEPSRLDPGVDGRLAFRRLCSACRRAVVPTFGFVVAAPSSLWAADIMGPYSAVVPDARGAHLCPHCARPLPGPPLWGSVRAETDGTVLRLRDDYRWTHSIISPHVLRSYPQIVDVAAMIWRDLERALAEHRLPTCVTPGCEEKARTVFTVGALRLGSVGLCGRDWQRGEQIRLCPRHAHDLYRGEDPAHPGDRRDDLIRGVRMSR